MEKLNGSGGSWQGWRWLVFTPFFVAAALVAAMLLYPLTGIGPINNTFALSALAAIAVGLVTGVVSLLLAKSIGAGWRLFIAALYFPVVVFCLLLAGF